MYENMYQQGESLFKQFNEIATLNAETISTLYDKQAAFVNAMVTDGIDYAKGLPTQKSVEALYESQKAYWESVQKKIADNAKDSFELLNETSEKITGMLQSVSVVEPAKPAKTTRIPAKKKPAAKAKSAPAEEAPPAEPAPASAE